MALAKMCCCKVHQKTLNRKARHGLVAEAPARRGVTAKHQAFLPDKCAIRAKHKHVDPPQLSSATGEDGQVVGVDEVLGENDVTLAQQGCQGSYGQIPDAHSS